MDALFKVPYSLRRSDDCGSHIFFPMISVQDAATNWPVHSTDTASAATVDGGAQAAVWRGSSGFVCLSSSCSVVRAVGVLN